MEQVQKTIQNQTLDASQSTHHLKHYNQQMGAGDKMEIEEEKIPTIVDEEDDLMSFD